MIVKDGIFGSLIRISDERIEHIVNTHPEMINANEEIIQTLENPEYVISSVSDEFVYLYYKKFDNQLVGEKLMCVVIKNLEVDCFLLTAYFTDKIKKGQILWKKK